MFQLKLNTYEVKKLLFLFFMLYHGCGLLAQNSADTLKQEQTKATPMTRQIFYAGLKFFNELQHYDKNGTIST